MSALDMKPLFVPDEILSDISPLLNQQLSNVIANDKLEIPKSFLQWTSHLRQLLLEDRPALLVRPSLNAKKSWSLENFRCFTVVLGRALGNLVIQNTEGDKLVTVYDRDPNKTMASGARYHQTHEGGSIHTDNVNIPEPWQYLILSCLEPAPVGGENILVNGDSVVERMRQEFPKSLAILEANFWWEKRGVSDELYQAPIITYDDQGHAYLRHLRPYMESAHRRAEQPMTAEQIKAVDVLDAYLNSSSIQARFNLEGYDCLLSLDSRTLHGRTCFADAVDAIAITDWDKNPNAPKRRTMERLWIRESV